MCRFHLIMGGISYSKGILILGALFGIFAVTLSISALFMLDEEYCPPEYEDNHDGGLGDCDVGEWGPDIDSIISRLAFSLCALLPISVTLLTYSLISQRESESADEVMEYGSNPIIKSIATGLGVSVTVTVVLIVLGIIILLGFVFWAILNFQMT